MPVRQKATGKTSPAAAAASWSGEVEPAGYGQRVPGSHPVVRAWLARHRRVRLHFTPTSGSWLNLVEVFFSIITRQAIRRGTFGSVGDLIGAIHRFIDGWNDRCHPFSWTKTPEEVLRRATRRQRSSDARH